MGCYLCAYQKTFIPARPDPLPATSPAAPADSLGTCGQCSVAACAAHASRYGMYLCAMCRAGAPMAQALAPAPPAGPTAVDRSEAMAVGAATTLARDVGVRARPEQQQRVEQALLRIAHDAAVAPLAGVERLAPAEPNIAWNLGEAIASLRGERMATVPAVHDHARARLLAEVEEPVEVSVDAIAGAVRGLFAANRPRPVTDESVVVVTGALIMAMTVADEPDRADGRAGAVVDPREVEVPPPWAVSHPILLPPTAWLVATAYHLI